MKLMHVVPHIDQEASGPSYSVPRLCQSLAALGHEVELSCLAARGEIPGVVLDLHPEWPILKRFAVSPSFAGSLHRKTAMVDVVHNHSLWSMVNVASGWIVPGHHAKLVTSPRGTLSPWALRRTRHLKQLLKPLQWRALTHADLLHATSEVELYEIRALGLDAPVAVIPNGIDIPPLLESARPETVRTMLFLSRIHPIKGLNRLLHAWKALQHLHIEWKLVVAGQGEDVHVREAVELAQALKLERVEFPGPLFGEQKERAYREAALFVLPSHSENFGMVVAEALAHACPAVVSKGAPWSGLESEGCGWWVDHDVEGLAAALGKAMALPAEHLSEMGLKGRAWMERDFGWPTVAERMEATYSWMSHGGVAPAWLRIDR
jgi:glycosyltransferase involved in cell wall biosynthesis